LKEVNRLRVFENRVLRKIFEPKRNEVTGEWKKLHIQEFNNLYTSHNIFRKMKKKKKIRWTGHVARMGEKRGA
jgi:hypothetical protein